MAEKETPEQVKASLVACIEEAGEWSKKDVLAIEQIYQLARIADALDAVALPWRVAEKDKQALDEIEAREVQTDEKAKSPTP